MATCGGSSRTSRSRVTVVTASRRPNSTGLAAVTVSVALPGTIAGCATLPSGRMTQSRSDDACFTCASASAGAPEAPSSVNTGMIWSPWLRVAVSAVSRPAGASTKSSSEPFCPTNRPGLFTSITGPASRPAMYQATPAVPAARITSARKARRSIRIV